MLKALPWLALAALPLAATAQPVGAWQACTGVADDAKRLACFDAWAHGQRPPVAAPAATPGPRRGLVLTASEDCHDRQYSELSRFWELEEGADCGTFGIRGYRPISVAVAGANSINREPTSENPRNNVGTPTEYRTTEARLQLSVRTKVAQGLFAYGDRGLDSLWFAYSQLSYWQIFTPQLSRPFRNTDHEPEVFYILPLQKASPNTWRLRLAGFGVVHQSNGQSLPLSRSWNRVYLLAGAEYNGLQLHARVWNRLDEKRDDDDNPRISDYVGRGELAARWEPDRKDVFALTWRHSLKKDANGSVRLEWFHSLADPGWGLPNGLRLHTQLFSGYGDTLLDYNRARTTLSIGLSLVEW